MRDDETDERRRAAEFAGLTLSELLDEWEEPLRERDRQLVRAELESRGYRAAWLVEPGADPARPRVPQVPGVPRSSASDHPGVLELTRRESLQSYAIAAVMAAAGAWALLAFDLGGSVWVGAVGGAIAASFVCTRVARVKVDASAEELIEAARCLYQEASVEERDGPRVVLRVRAKTALVAGRLRLQEVDDRASIVVGSKIAIDALARKVRDRSD